MIASPNCSRIPLRSLTRPDEEQQLRRQRSTDNVTGSASNVEDSSTQPILVDISKMQYDDLYLVATKQNEDLQALREFSDIEKELWRQEREIASSEKDNMNNELLMREKMLLDRENEISEQKARLSEQQIELENARKEVMEANKVLDC